MPRRNSRIEEPRGRSGRGEYWRRSSPPIVRDDVRLGRPRFLQGRPQLEMAFGALLLALPHDTQPLGPGQT